MKKLIIFLYMLVCCTFSYSSSVDNNENYLKEKNLLINSVISLEEKESFISELTAHNPAAYYIVAGRNNSFQPCDIKQNENQCISEKVKEISDEEKYSENIDFSDEEIILFSYDIATDINRSLRN